MVATTVPQKEIEGALRDSALLRDVPGSVVGKLASQGRLKGYRHGTYLFHQGDDSADVGFLVRGRIEISTISQGGQRQLHTILNEPTFFGELGVLGGVPRTATALALEDTTIWVIEADDFMEFLDREPSVMRQLLAALVGQLLANEAFVDDLLFLDLKGRVAKRLLQLVSSSLDDLPSDGVVVPSVVTHADLASLCGGSRENVTRILSDFQRRKLIDRDGRRYVLKNVDGLARLAGL